jgi:ParB family chromosome partitioning protein
MSFAEVTRQDAGKWLEICSTTTAARLPLLMLTSIAVTYEYAMTQGEGRNTWRTDNRYSPCPRTQAGEYLAFLASIGHTLTPIEQAVADGIPWTGDTPIDTLTSGDDPASDGETHPDGSGPGDDRQTVTDAADDIGQAAA